MIIFPCHYYIYLYRYRAHLDNPRHSPHFQFDILSEWNHKSMEVVHMPEEIGISQLKHLFVVFI